MEPGDFDSETNMEEARVSQNKGVNYLIPASIILAGIIIAGSIVYVSGKQTQNSPSANGNQGNNQVAQVVKPIQASSSDVVLGDIKAPINIVEYGDYQCPYCGRFFATIEASMRKDYIEKGKAKMVFRNFTFLGPESQAAAEAAECAKDQHQFWAFHDALYTAEIQDGHENNGNLNRDLFMKIAGTLKFDTNVFAQCIDSHKYASAVQSETQDGVNNYGVESTPTTFINNQKLLGALPYNQFQSVIDGLINNK